MRKEQIFPKRDVAYFLRPGRLQFWKNTHCLTQAAKVHSAPCWGLDRKRRGHSLSLTHSSHRRSVGTWEGSAHSEQDRAGRAALEGILWEEEAATGAGEREPERRTFCQWRGEGMVTGEGGSAGRQEAGTLSGGAGGLV